MPSEKVEVTQRTATDADIAAFVRGEDNSYVDGSRYDIEPRGVGSGDNYVRSQLDARELAQEQPRLAEERMLSTDPYTAPNPEWQQSQQPQDQNWQQMYGREANEKGQWRRTAEEAMAELQQLRGEIAQLRSGQYGPPYADPGSYTPPPQQQQYYQQPQYAYPQQQVQQPATPQLPETYFPGRSAEDTVEVREVDALIKNSIAPAVFQLHLQQQALLAAQLASAKAAVGITPQVEQRLLATHPWLQNMVDSPQRVQAMRDILQRPVQPVSPAVAAQQQPLMNPAQAAARRVTFVESGKPAQNAPDEGPTLEQIIAREFSAAKTAAEKRAVLLKHGVGQYNDWGPEFLTR